MRQPVWRTTDSFKWSPSTALKAGALLLLSVLLSGCGSVGYYTQAVKGHCQVVSRQTSCDKLVANTNTAPELKAKLELANALCTFAEQDLDLPTAGAYQRYADLERPYVVWNVYAAPAYSLEAKTWWYPFVGSLDYRGYFNEDAAHKYAGKLEKQGLDVFVEGVQAYSTLGWFRDPLLNTFLYHPEPILAEILFHELAHQKVFVSGDTDFNEAFATVVAKVGVRRWLEAQNDVTLLEQYEAALERENAFVQLVQQSRSELETLYAVEPNTDLEADKQRVINGLRQDYEVLLVQTDLYKGYEAWFAENLNNAKLNSIATYYDLVPAFDRLLASHDGNLEAFYAAVHGLTKLTESERQEQLTGGPAELATIDP